MLTQYSEDGYKGYGELEMSGELKVERGDMDGSIITDDSGDRCYIYDSELDDVIIRLLELRGVEA